MKNMKFLEITFRLLRLPFIFVFGFQLVAGSASAQSCDPVWDLIFLEEPSVVYMETSSLQIPIKSMLIDGELVQGYEISRWKVGDPYHSRRMKQLGARVNGANYFIPVPSKMKLPEGLKIELATPLIGPEFSREEYWRKLAKGIVLISTKMYDHDIIYHAPGFVILAKTPYWFRATKIFERAFEISDAHPELREKMETEVMKNLASWLESLTANLNQVPFLKFITPESHLRDFADLLYRLEKHMDRVESNLIKEDQHLPRS